MYNFKCDCVDVSHRKRHTDKGGERKKKNKHTQPERKERRINTEKSKRSGVKLLNARKKNELQKVNHTLIIQLKFNLNSK